MSTPDGDFLDWDWLVDATDHPSEAPIWVLFHGLEGSSESHYAKALGAWALRSNARLVVIHFRGCSGEQNWTPRAYHSGDHAEINWVLKLIRQRHPESAIFAVGVSLGGNALLHWAGTQGSAASLIVNAVLAVSAPLDLVRSGNALDSGWNKQLYTRMFLQTMKVKAQDKWRQFPGLFDLKRALHATTLREFDDAFTAPIHGFGTVDRYWSEASALPHLRGIQVPTCVLNALNDPFVPSSSLPGGQQVSSFVELVQPMYGGHVGFSKLSDGRVPLLENLKNQALPQFLFNWVAGLAQKSRQEV